MAIIPTHFNKIPGYILTIPSQRQFNIKSYREVDEKIQVIFRMLVETKECTNEQFMQIDKATVLFLSEASEDALTKWAKEHNSCITKVTHLQQKVFRTDAYSVFMFDVPEQDRISLEKKMEEVTSLSEVEKIRFTQGTWWDQIDVECQNTAKDKNTQQTPAQSKSHYELLCYRALKTLKEDPTFDIDDCSTILHYCGIRIDGKRLEFMTSQKTFINNCIQEFTSIHDGKNERLLLLVESKLKNFLKALPQEDWLCVSTDYHDNPRTFIFPRTWNKILKHVHGIDAVLSQPAGGYSHQHRFAAAISRISATFLPGVMPPLFIHQNPCQEWLMDTVHDQIHLMHENTNFLNPKEPSRESWIHLATYIWQKTQDKACYDALLDRAFGDDSFTERIFPIIWRRQNVSAHIEEWQKRYLPLFTHKNQKI